MSPCLLFLLLSVSLSWCAPNPPLCRLSLAGPEEPLIASATLCPLERAGDRGQDSSARAFRSKDGSVSLVAGNEAGNYRSIRAPNSSEFVRDCSRPPFLNQAIAAGGAAGASFPELYASPQNANGDCYLGSGAGFGSCVQNATAQAGGGQAFGLYSPNQFTMATWAMQDVTNASSDTVYAFGQSTLYGNGGVNPLLPGCWSRCGKGEVGSFYQYMTGMVSKDGGASYAFLAAGEPPSPAVFVPSQRFNSANSGNSYISSMANIVQDPRNASAGWFTQTHGFGDCVWRTLDITDPTAWRAWDGRDYSIPSISPYGPGGDAGLNCTSATNAQLGSISWSTVCGCWVAVGGARAAGAPPTEKAFTYSTSLDLHSWSDAAFLAPNADGQDNYPTLIDLSDASEATDANFVLIGASPTLIYRRMDADQKAATTYQRAVVVTPNTVDPNKI